jgi:hypothetical protein
LTPAQIELIIDYLLAQQQAENPALGQCGGECAAGGDRGAEGVSGQREQSATPTTGYSLLMVQLFLLVMVFILTIFVSCGSSRSRNRKIFPAMSSPRRFAPGDVFARGLFQSWGRPEPPTLK